MGFPAALAYGWIGRRIGALNGIFIALAVYVGATCFAYFVDDVSDFFLLAVVIGLVQGGIQSLSRSYYGRLVPAGKSSEFFGFYNMMGKASAIVGPILVGVTAAVTHDQRLSILSILLLFISGGWVLMIAARSARTDSLVRNGNSGGVQWHITMKYCVCFGHWIAVALGAASGMASRPGIRGARARRSPLRARHHRRDAIHGKPSSDAATSASRAMHRRGARVICRALDGHIPPADADDALDDADVDVGLVEDCALFVCSWTGGDGPSARRASASRAGSPPTARIPSRIVSPLWLTTLEHCRADSVGHRPGCRRLRLLRR